MGWTEWFDLHGPVIGFSLLVAAGILYLIFILVRWRQGKAYEESPGKFYRSIVRMSHGRLQKTDPLNCTDSPHPLDDDVLSQTREREWIDE